MRGNNDGPEFVSRLPEVRTLDLAGVRVAVVHETGPRTGRETRVDTTFPDSDLVIFGHSHIPWDSRTRQGRRVLNPGSPTDRRRQPFCTYMTVRLDAGSVLDVQLHSLVRTG